MQRSSFHPLFGDTADRPRARNRGLVAPLPGPSARRLHGGHAQHHPDRATTAPAIASARLATEYAHHSRRCSRSIR